LADDIVSALLVGVLGEEGLDDDEDARTTPAVVGCSPGAAVALLRRLADRLGVAGGLIGPPEASWLNEDEGMRIGRRWGLEMRGSEGFIRKAGQRSGAG
jgi:hypothetical protein